MSAFPFIVISGDWQVIEALEMLVGKVFHNVELQKAFDGVDGMKLIKKTGSPAVVFCDLKLQGYSGIELLDKIKADPNLSKIFFVLIISTNEKEIAIKALQKGADDLMHKPLSIDETLSRLKTISRIINVQEKELHAEDQIQEQKQAYEVYLKDILLGYNKILENMIPSKIHRLNKIASAAKWIAYRVNNYNIDEIPSLELSANLIYLGKLGLDAESINDSVTKDGYLAEPKYARVAAFPQEVLAKIEPLELVRDALVHIYENLDGSGFPEKKKAWMIPKSSRILRVLIDFEQLILDENHSQTQAIERLMLEAKRIYDYDVIALLDQYLANFEQQPSYPEQRLDLPEVREGMVVSRTVITFSGLVLVPKKTTLNMEMIRKIKSIVEKEGIIGDIYIYKQK